MGISKLLVLVFLMGSSSLFAQTMNYVACSPKAIGCTVGRYSAGGGMGWSRFKDQTSFWPHVQLEVGLLKMIAVEITAGGIKSQELYQSLSAAPSLVFGAGVQIYPDGLYRGLVWRGAVMAHLYKEDSTNQRYTTEKALLSTVGWRWRPKEYAGSFTLGLGGQKVFGKDRPIQPVVETQIAVDFNLDSVFF
ncbi:MAG: hypothetical protein EBR01_12310 [Proteobacteria bacterium]|nr:hypothetical protein [Pseudomonadota bacterium]NBY20977.1 hypothetical protein [bacterium]